VLLKISPRAIQKAQTVACSRKPCIPGQQAHGGHAAIDDGGWSARCRYRFAWTARVLRTDMAVHEEARRFPEKRRRKNTAQYHLSGRDTSHMFVD
jgi:hypothetical protein